MPDIYSYDYEWDEKYCYPNSFVLKNKLNILDPNALNNAEREITAMKILFLKNNIVKGNFDLKPPSPSENGIIILLHFLEQTANKRGCLIHMTLTLSMNPPTKVRVDNAIKTEYLNTESRLKCGFFCYRNGGRIAKDTKPLFSIPSHHFLFYPGNISPIAFIDTLQLEESEYGLIKYPERGTCLYRCGNERYLLQVISPAYKAEMFGLAGGR